MCDRMGMKQLDRAKENNSEQELQASSAGLHSTTAVYKERRRIMERVLRRANGCANTKFTIKDIEKIVSDK